MPGTGYYDISTSTCVSCQVLWLKRRFCINFSADDCGGYMGKLGLVTFIKVGPEAPLSLVKSSEFQRRPWKVC